LHLCNYHLEEFSSPFEFLEGFIEIEKKSEKKIETIIIPKELSSNLERKHGIRQIESVFEFFVMNRE